MAHCIRLLWSGINILEHGEPIVRFEGEQLQYLKDIRLGKYDYDELMSLSEDLMRQMDEKVDKSSLPDSPDMEAVDRLYKELIKIE